MSKKQTTTYNWFQGELKGSGLSNSEVSGLWRDYKNGKINDNDLKKYKKGITNTDKRLPIRKSSLKKKQIKSEVYGLLNQPSDILLLMMKDMEIGVVLNFCQPINLTSKSPQSEQTKFLWFRKSISTWIQSSTFIIL